MKESLIDKQFDFIFENGVADCDNFLDYLAKMIIESANEDANKNEPAA